MICRSNQGSEVLCRGLYRWGGVVNWHVTNPSASVVKSRSRCTSMRSRTQKRPGPPAQASLLLPDRGGRHELATSFSMLGWCKEWEGKRHRLCLFYLFLPLNGNYYYLDSATRHTSLFQASMSRCATVRRSCMLMYHYPVALDHRYSDGYAANIGRHWKCKSLHRDLRPLVRTRCRQHRTRLVSCNFSL